MVKKNINHRISETIRETTILIDEVIRNSNRIYSVYLNTLLNDTAVIENFNNRDRDALYTAVLPFHKQLKSKNIYYSNMHFHLPSGISFLRMHKPKEYGDDLKLIRPIIIQVHKTQKSVFGYEVGKHGLFFRVAKPIFFNSQYIGALELGIKAEEVAMNIKRILNVDVARVIANNLLNDAFRTYCKNEIIVQGFSVNPYGNSAIFKELLPAIDLPQLVTNNISKNNKNHLIFDAGDLKNYLGQSLAHLLVVQNFSETMIEYKTFIRNSIYLTLILVGCAFLILQLSFGVYINKIIELNKTLEKRVKERTKDLESVTDQLKSTNAELFQIFNTAADGMRVIDLNFKILRVNDTFAKIMDQDKEQLENQLCHTDFQGAFCHSPDCTLKRIQNGEQHLEITVDKEIKPGEKRSFLLTATPYKSSTGELLGVVENFKDITEHQNIFMALKENERYLKAIMDTVQAGVIVTDEKNPLIIDANPYALKMIGCGKTDLKKLSIRDHFSLEKPWIDHVLSTDETIEKEGYTLTTTSGETRSIRLSMARTKVKGKNYLVQSFSDMTDVKQMIEKQIVDIHKAKAVMDLVNPAPLQYIELSQKQRLFTDSVSVPCNAEGGDHFFIHHLCEQKSPKTIISLKDQSGHEVNCILRSIYTDLLHNHTIFSNPKADLDTIITQLNRQLCQSGFFNADDFFTTINCEIDHKNLILKYISAGHPPFLLIRDKKVTALPETGTGQDHLPIPFLADTQYVSSSVQLKENDLLLFYTDGLSEMTLNHLNRILTIQELVKIAQTVVNQEVDDTGETMPVSILVERLLETVAKLSCETVYPNKNGKKAKNTSQDDVTLIGIEVETLKPILQETICPENSKNISKTITSCLESLFGQAENRPYSHLKNRITMILEEAIVNAWKHGNKKSKEKSITICCYSHNDFVFHIIDQGDGFGHHILPDPTSQTNIEKPSGRGLFIIRHFSDHVQWKENGKHIIIVLKKIKELDDRETIKDEIFKIRLWE